jgi:hypothetical protein
MKERLLCLGLLVGGLVLAAPGIAAADAGWMQAGVRVWYLGGVGGGGVTSSNAEEAYLINAVIGTNARVVHHSALTHWTSPQPVDTGTYPMLDMGPCWIHPARLQTLQMGDYWKGQEITLVVRSTYTYATFLSSALPAQVHFLPIKALFALAPQRQIVKITYMMAGFSFGTAYFDGDTGILLYYDALWGANAMFFVLAEINYDFAGQAASAEDDGPHTGFKSFVGEQSLGSTWGVGGGSIIIQSLVESRYGRVIEMRVLTSLSATGYKSTDENYCFFGDVPILRRVDALQAPNSLPEQWNAFGQYLWWWLPPISPQTQTINVFDVPMARSADQSLTFTATTQPQRFYFTTLWFGSDGYLTAFAAKDPTIGLEVAPTDLIFQNLTTVDGPSYYRTVMALPTFTDDPLQARITLVKAVHLNELRRWIDELRVRFTLGAYTWTDATLVPGATAVKAAHVTELRTALAAVYTAAGRAVPTWNPPTIAAGTVISSAQVAEVRAAILAIW